MEGQVSVFSNNYLQAKTRHFIQDALFDWWPEMMAKAHQHESTLDPENPRDYLDSLLNEYRSCEDIGYVSLMSTLIILYAAGGDTTANTLRWILIFLARHPGMNRSFFNKICC